MSPSPESEAEIQRLQTVVAQFDHQLEADPGALFPPHAEALTRLAQALAAAGDMGGAIAAAARGVGLYRAMAEVQPAGFRAQLASALNGLSVRLSEAGDAGQAREAGEEALALARVALAEQPDRARFVLVSALVGQGGRRMADGDVDGCLDAMAEAVEVFRAAGDSGADYLSIMIEALHRTSMALGEAGVWTQAVDARRLMLRLFAGGQPPAMVHLLALTLQQASLGAAAANDLNQAMAWADESVELARILFDKDKGDYTLFLAQSLGNQAGRRLDLDDLQGALDGALNAVNLFHEVVGLDPKAAVPSMILTLGTLAAVLSALGMEDQAAIVTEQRTQLQKTLEVLTGNPAANT
jgi:tetratricopeptide (TPR) repeat protein